MLQLTLCFLLWIERKATPDTGRRYHAGSSSLLIGALRGGLGWTLHEGSHLDGARAHGGDACGDGDGFVEVFGVDEVIAAELFTGLGERTVGDEAFAVAYPDTRGCRCRLQLRTGQPLSGRLDLLGEFHEFSHENLPLGLGELTPGFLFVVNEQHVFHCGPP